MKKTFAMLLVLCLMLGCLAACASETAPADTTTPAGTTTDTPADTATEAPAEDVTDEPADVTDEPAETVEEPADSTDEPAVEEPTTITVNYPLSDEPLSYHVMATGLIMESAVGLEDMNTNPAIMAFNEKTNVSMEWEFMSSAAQETTVSLMLVSESYPEGLIYWPTLMGSSTDYLIEEEVLVDMKDMLKENCPNFWGIAESDPQVMRDISTDNGHVPAMWRITDRRPQTYGGFYVTTAVLEEAGFSADNLPQTYDDFELMLQAAMDDVTNAPLYLDGTARTYLMVGHQAKNGFIHNGDKQLYYGPIHESFKDYLTMMADWAGKGYLDKDFASRRIFYFDNGCLLSGEVALMPGVFSFGTMYENQGLSVQPIPFPQLEPGAARYYAYTGDDSRVSTSGIGLMTFTTTENPIPLLQYWDYAYSEEGAITANFGVEGLNYEIDENGDVKPYPTDAHTGTYTFGSMFPFLRLTWSEYIGETAIATLSREIWDQGWSEESRDFRGALTAEESEEVAGIMADIQTYVDEYLLGVINGSRSIDEWDSYVDYIRNLGIDRCTEVYQAAYDRYLVR